MQRRHFQLQLAALAVSCALPGRAADGWEPLEEESRGRLGVAVLRAGGGIDGHRLDERFPMCSTFKWLAAAHVLHRVEMNQERLERRVRFGRDQLRAYSPVTSRHAGGEGMTVAQLCHAAVTESDNTAANLLLASSGGPQGLTRYARSVGDDVTRLDRWEPALNEARPGDPRDTTTPRAMAGNLHAHLIGTALAPAGREQLAKWLQASETNHLRLRADLPQGWRMGSKTGTGGRGTTNDVGIFWPPNRPALVVAAFLTQTKAPEAVRNRAIAQVARRVTASR